MSIWLGVARCSFTQTQNSHLAELGLAAKKFLGAISKCMRVVHALALFDFITKVGAESLIITPCRRVKRFRLILANLRLRELAARGG